MLDHADPDDRRRAEHVSGKAWPESADRVTVVALENGEPKAFMTVDSPPGQPITIPDWNATGPDTTRDAAMLWWLANHQARLDRPSTNAEAVRVPAPQQETGDKGKRWSGRHNRRSKEGGAQR